MPKCRNAAVELTDTQMISILYFYFIGIHSMGATPLGNGANQVAETHDPIHAAAAAAGNLWKKIRKISQTRILRYASDFLEPSSRFKFPQLNI